MRTVYKSPKVRPNKGFSKNAQEDRSKKRHLPNSLVMRIMEESSAEQEADALSSGVTSTDPSSLREEMGSRLGADFSGVRFHNDDASVSRSMSMGARAWTRGSDIYFGWLKHLKFW